MTVGFFSKYFIEEEVVGVEIENELDPFIYTLSNFSVLRIDRDYISSRKLDEYIYTTPSINRTRVGKNNPFR